jgi:hypothetical protein
MIRKFVIKPADMEKAQEAMTGQVIDHTLNGNVLTVFNREDSDKVYRLFYNKRIRFDEM